MATKAKEPREHSAAKPQPNFYHEEPEGHEGKETEFCMSRGRLIFVLFVVKKSCQK